MTLADDPGASRAPATAGEPEDGDLETQIASLIRHLRSTAPIAVACSGGVDSSFLLAAARRADDRTRAIIGVSPALSRVALDRARVLANRVGVVLEESVTNEHQDPAYRRNGPDRCFHCKQTLYTTFFQRIGPQWTLMDGTQADDVHDWRPGRQAARDLGVRSPLLETGWSKEDVRRASRLWGLETAELPGSPCLSSRIPTGTPITESALLRVERAEDGLRDLGFDVARVRDHGTLARIEFSQDRMAEALGIRKEIVDTVAAAGYIDVVLDLRGYRPSGMPDRLRSPEGLTAAPGRPEGNP